jgi:hypothetical protein
MTIGNAPEGIADQTDQVAIMRHQHDRAGEVGERFGEQHTEATGRRNHRKGVEREET